MGVSYPSRASRLCSSQSKLCDSLAQGTEFRNAEKPLTAQGDMFSRGAQLLRRPWHFRWTGRQPTGRALFLDCQWTGKVLGRPYKRSSPDVSTFGELASEPLHLGPPPQQLAPGLTQHRSFEQRGKPVAAQAFLTRCCSESVPRWSQIR